MAWARQRLWARGLGPRTSGRRDQPLSGVREQGDAPADSSWRAWVGSGVPASSTGRSRCRWAVGTAWAVGVGLRAEPELALRTGALEVARGEVGRTEPGAWEEGEPEMGRQRGRRKTRRREAGGGREGSRVQQRGAGAHPPASVCLEEEEAFSTKAGACCRRGSRCVCGWEPPRAPLDRLVTVVTARADGGLKAGVPRTLVGRQGR